MSKVTRFAADVIGFIGFALALPFCVVALWLDDRADDLEGGWRRGRKQNWLWRWSARRKSLSSGKRRDE